jgi:hypothetical protein
MATATPLPGCRWQGKKKNGSFRSIHALQEIVTPTVLPAGRMWWSLKKSLSVQMSDVDVL